MAIASGVAVSAMSFLAVDAGVVNPGGIAKRIEVAQTSLIGAAASQYRRAFAVQASAGGSSPALHSDAERRENLMPCRAEPVI
jgi:hypothetical protein